MKLTYTKDNATRKLHFEVEISERTLGIYGHRLDPIDKALLESTNLKEASPADILLTLEMLCRNLIAFWIPKNQKALAITRA